MRRRKSSKQYAPGCSSWQGYPRSSLAQEARVSSCFRLNEISVRLRLPLQHMLYSHQLASVPADFVSAMSGPSRQLGLVQFEIPGTFLLSPLLRQSAGINRSAFLWKCTQAVNLDHNPSCKGTSAYGNQRVMTKQLSDLSRLTDNLYDAKSSGCITLPIFNVHFPLLVLLPWNHCAPLQYQSTRMACGNGQLNRESWSFYLVSTGHSTFPYPQTNIPSVQLRYSAVGRAEPCSWLVIRHVRPKLPLREY